MNVNRAATDPSSAPLQEVDPSKINLEPQLSRDEIQNMCETMDGNVLDGEWDRPRKRTFTETAIYQGGSRAIRLRRRVD